MTDILRLLTLLAILTCALGCDETQRIRSQGGPDRVYGSIEALASAGGTLYLGNRRTGVSRFDQKTQSWENMDSPIALVFTLAVDHATLYVGGAGGIYRLEPDGKTFTEIPAWTHQIVRGLAVERNTIYAIFDKKLVRSTDGGLSWDEMDTRPWHDFQRVMSVVVEGNTIYVFTDRQGVFLSSDGGERWTVIKGLPDQPSGLSINLPLLLDKNTLYIGTTTGVYRLLKDTTTAIPTGIHDWAIISLETFDNALYAGSFRNGLFRSYDGGKSWRNIGFSGERINAIAGFGNRLYVGTRKSLFYSEAKGVTWQKLNKGLDFEI